MEEDCTSLISMLDIVQSCDCDFAFKTQTANFPSTKSRPQPSSRPIQILLTVCLFPEIFLAYFCWSSKHALAVILMHLAVRIMIGLLTRRRLFLDRLHAERCGRDAGTFQLLSTITSHPNRFTIEPYMRWSHSFEEYFDHFYISDYCLCTNRSISKHNCKIICAGCVRDGRHINLVMCHIGVSFTFFVENPL